MTYIGKVSDEEMVFVVASIPEVDPGVYIGTLIGMRPFTMTTPEGEKRDLIEWRFTAKDGAGVPVVDNEGSILELSGVTSKATGPASKWFAWTVALIGAAAIVPDAQIRARDLIGKQAQVTIGPDKKGYPKVQSLTAMPRTRPAAPVAAAPAPAQEQVPDEAAPNFDDLPF